MAAFQVETNLTLLNTGESSPAQIDPFGVPLDAMSVQAYTLDPLTNNGYGSQELVDRLVDGEYQFCYGSGNRITSEGDEFIFAHLFGLEAPEFASWWYSGSPGIGEAVGEIGADSGEAIIAAQIAAQPTENRGGLIGDHDYSNMIVFPILCVRGESAGWFKESVTMKKLRDGVYADGSPINIRLADEAKPAHVKAFPKVGTPAATDGVSFLGDMINGTYSAGEFASPIVDASQINGLFPAYPDGAGGIIEAGLKHYYMGCWGTPMRGRIMMVNRTWFLSQTPAQQQMIRSAAKDAHFQNMANQMANQDAILEQFQTLGAQIHRSLPSDVLSALRQGVDEVYVEYGLVTGKGPEYAQIRDHQRAFIQRNRIGWESANLDRRARFSGRLNYGATLQPNS